MCYEIKRIEVFITYNHDKKLQYIQNQMDELESKYRELEDEGVKIEKYIRGEEIGQFTIFTCIHSIYLLKDFCFSKIFGKF